MNTNKDIDLIKRRLELPNEGIDLTEGVEERFHQDGIEYQVLKQKQNETPLLNIIAGHPKNKEYVQAIVALHEDYSTENPHIYDQAVQLLKEMIIIAAIDYDEIAKITKSKHVIGVDHYNKKAIHPIQKVASEYHFIFLEQNQDPLIFDHLATENMPNEKWRNPLWEQKLHAQTGIENALIKQERLQRMNNVSDIKQSYEFQQRLRQIVNAPRYQNN